MSLLRFDEILGQRPAIELLRGALAAERLPHALLFHGPPCTGKATVARTLAAAILCESGPERPCGRCGACLRVAHGQHPDLFWITRLPRKPTSARARAEDEDDEEGPESGDLSPWIKVGQVRELTEHAAFAPREGARRIFVIDPADRMNAEAQNALLKTLEEPPGRALLVLVSSRPHVLLPTIRSRCLPVGFAPLPVRELASALVARGTPQDEALTRASLAEGCPGRALEIDVDARLERRDEVLRALEALARSPRALGDLPTWTAALAPKEEETLLEGLELMEGLLRDAARAASGLDARALLHADQAKRLAALGSRLGAARAAALVRSIESARGGLRFHVNRTLLAEALLCAVAGGPLP